jgi:phosphopantothenate---cysteine ligase (CTP)
MIVLVTSGGTREAIDDVRVMTNISTGKLGARIAGALMEAGHDVIYLHGVGAEKPVNRKLGANLSDWYGAARTHEAETVDDVVKAMEALVPKVDAVIHAMALSDFTFERGDDAVKLKSSDPEAFIEYLRANIRKAPKILQLIKGWNPEVTLVSFKFEVGLCQGLHKEEPLLEAAFASMDKAGGDFVFANDLVEIRDVRRGRHGGYLVDRTKYFREVEGRENIASLIVAALECHLHEWQPGKP